MSDDFWFWIVAAIATACIVAFIASVRGDDAMALAKAQQSSSENVDLDLTTHDAAPAESTVQAAAGPPGGNWRLFGWLVFVAGAIGLAISLNLKTTVDTFAPDALGGAVPSEVVNLDLLFRKGVAIGSSLAAMIMGLVAAAAGAIMSIVATSDGR